MENQQAGRDPTVPLALIATDERFDARRSDERKSDGRVTSIEGCRFE